MLFHASAAAALGDDAALELADWACRRLLHLNTGAHGFAAAPGAPQAISPMTNPELADWACRRLLHLNTAAHAFAAAPCAHQALFPMTNPELADWACRRLLYLNTAGHAFAAAPGTDRGFLFFTISLLYCQHSITSHAMQSRQCVCSLPLQGQHGI